MKNYTIANFSGNISENLAKLSIMIEEAARDAESEEYCAQGDLLYEFPAKTRLTNYCRLDILVQ